MGDLISKTVNYKKKVPITELKQGKNTVSVTEIWGGEVESPVSKDEINKSNVNFEDNYIGTEVINKVNSGGSYFDEELISNEIVEQLFDEKIVNEECSEDLSLSLCDSDSDNVVVEESDKDLVLNDVGDKGIVTGEYDEYLSLDINNGEKLASDKSNDEKILIKELNTIDNDSITKNDLDGNIGSVGEVDLGSDSLVNSNSNSNSKDNDNVDVLEEKFHQRPVNNMSLINDESIGENSDSYGQNIIKVSNVFKSYDGGRINALNGVSIEIKKGEFVSIMGPSGSGKSTLLNMCGALDKPSSGDVFIDGENLNDVKDLSEIRSSQIGFIFQMHNLIPSLSVLDNVMVPLFETSIKSSERKRIALSYLDIVGLEDKANLRPNVLSGGERQRVAIARALVNSPSIILADEPTGALDSTTGNEIMNFLKLLHQNNEVTLIVVTHDPNVGSMADRTINVLDGKIQN